MMVLNKFKSPNLWVCLALAILSFNSCDRYELSLPECYLRDDIIDIPYTWEVEELPFLDIRFGEDIQHVILQDRLSNFAKISCPTDRDTCLRYISQHSYDRLFELDFARTSKLEQYMNSVGIQTPLLSLDSLQRNESGIIHMGLTIFNSCNRAFEPMEGLSLNESYNLISDVQVQTVEDLTFDGGNVKITYLFVTGELKTQFDVLGEITPVTINYRLGEYVTENQ